MKTSESLPLSEPFGYGNHLIFAQLIDKHARLASNNALSISAGLQKGGSGTRVQQVSTSKSEDEGTESREFTEDAQPTQTLAEYKCWKKRRDEDKITGRRKFARDMMYKGETALFNVEPAVRWEKIRGPQYFFGTERVSLPKHRD